MTVESATMPDAPRLRLGMTLDTTWSVKDYLLSGTMARLAQDYQVTCWVPLELLEGTLRLAQDLALTGVSFREAPVVKPTRLYDALCGSQKALLFERHDIGTERVMRRRQSGPSVRARSHTRRAAGWLIRAVAKSAFAPALDRALYRLRARLARDAKSNRELDAVSPDALFITDPVRREFDPLFFEACRRGLRTICLVLSWDNVTSKGRLHSEFDRILTWNESMRGDVLKLYPDRAPASVCVVGYPRFDIYRQDLPPTFEREPFMRSLGLDPAHPFILFSGIATSSFRAQPDIVEHICAALEAGELGSRTQLLVRCHPHDDISVYARFRGRKRVAVWPDEARLEGKETLFDLAPRADELWTLGASVRHSAVCVNPGSTVMLDASIANVPIVSVNYDGDRALPYWQSFRSVYEFTHQQQFHAFGATQFANDRAELIRAIGAALRDPAERSAERAQAAAHFIGSREQGSIDRICAAVRELFAEARR
jgi:hypothetical protein